MQGLPSDDEELQIAIRPRQLFVETGDADDEEAEENLTQDTSDDEVFIVDEFKTPPSVPRENRLKEEMR